MEAIPLPNRATVVDLGQNKYSVILEPLYPGFRSYNWQYPPQVLLSSMPGAAVTAVKIKFATTNFPPFPMSKKRNPNYFKPQTVGLKSFSQEPVRLQLKSKGEKIITAADIKRPIR